jgi:AcrR family transcriptional regulator
MGIVMIEPSVSILTMLRYYLNGVKIFVDVSAISIYPFEMLDKWQEKRSASYHHGDLRDALVRAARTILEKQGLAALSLRGVARVVGVSPAAPYHHFPDKQALLEAVAAQGFDALTAAMEKRMAKKTDPTGRLDASGVGYVTFALENPALFRLMFGNGEQQPSAHARLREARDVLGRHAAAVDVGNGRRAIRRTAGDLVLAGLALERVRQSDNDHAMVQ